MVTVPDLPGSSRPLPQVSPEEAEQLLDNDPIDIGVNVVGGEERIASVGYTNKGRFLIVTSSAKLVCVSLQHFQPHEQ